MFNRSFTRPTGTRPSSMRTAAISIALAVFAASPFARGDWSISQEMDGQVYPSYVIATASVTLDDAERDDVLGDTNGLIGIEIVAPDDDAAVEVKLHAPGICDDSEVSVKLPKKGETYWVYPKMRFDYAKLGEVKQAVPVNVKVDVTIDGESAGSKDVTEQLRNIRECPFILTHSDEEGDDAKPESLGWMFAAYVNEDDPMIDKLLSEALKEGVVDHFDGYQSGDPQVVLKQVFAIWRTLQRKGVKYSDISTTSNSSELVMSQHVRLLEDCVNNHQANCVDGSVLLASCLRKIGLEPSLVLIPGHCFLAFGLDDKCEKTIGLETTLLGEAGADSMKTLDAKLGKQVAEDFDKAFENDPSFQSYSNAIDIGTDNISKHVEQFKSEDPQYQLVKVSEARAHGVAAIAALSTK